MLGRSSPRPSTPPSDFHPGARKRRRKALSCFDCRRRKLKCDREYPACTRCRKSGHPESCVYDAKTSVDGAANNDAAESVGSDDSEDDKTHPVLRGFDCLDLPGSAKPPSISTSGKPPISEEESSKVLAQAKRIKQLEAQIAGLESRWHPASWQSFGEIAPLEKTASGRPEVVTKTDPVPQPDPRYPETILFRGRNFKTQYYGPSNPTSLIAHFPELRSFMRDVIMHHTSLPRVQRDLKTFQVRWKIERVNVSMSTNQNLLELLPERGTADHLVRLYFETFETAYRILHAPTFWKDYESFWEDPPNGRPAFIVTLLLMMASVNCVSSKEPSTYIGDSSSAREMALLWIEACDAWLERQSQKHVYMAIFQIHCLMILAKQANVMKKKRAWTTAGNLIRLGMSTGFHRDPILLVGKTSVFDQEMRRRLWTTMVELELQASIDRGMPSASAGIPSDTAPPLNINDEDLSESSTQAPTQKPWSEYTAAGYLHVSRRSLPLRIALNSLVNQLSSQLQYEDVLSYDEKIMQRLEEISSATTAEQDGAVTGVQGLSGFPLLPLTLLDLQLRQFLILLHGPFARQAGSNSRYSFSKMVCFNAATKIIDQHDKLLNSGNSALCLLRTDAFRAALCICHTYFVSRSIQNDLFLLQNLSPTIFQHLEKALLMLEERIMRFGTGYTHYWYISAAFGLVQSEAAPGTLIAQKEQAIHRIARQYYKVLASQEELSAAKRKILLRGVASKATPTTMEEQQQQQLLPLPPPPPNFDPTLTATTATTNPSSNHSFPITDLTDVTTAPDGTSNGNPANDPQAAATFFFGDPAAWTFDNLWEFDAGVVLGETE